jgi:hypothetical protein
MSISLRFWYDAAMLWSIEQPSLLRTALVHLTHFVEAVVPCPETRSELRVVEQNLCIYRSWTNAYLRHESKARSSVLQGKRRWFWQLVQIGTTHGTSVVLKEPCGKAISAEDMVASRYVRNLNRKIIAVVRFKTDAACFFSFCVAINLPQIVFKQEEERRSWRKRRDMCHFEKEI